MRPYGECAQTPAQIREGRAILADMKYITWEDIVRSFNPNTIDLDTTRLFWKGLSSQLIDLPPTSELPDVSGIIKYDPAKPQRFYKMDLEILRNVAFVRPSLQDQGHDARTAYLRALIMQGLALANLSKPAEEVVEEQPATTPAEAASDPAESE